MFPSLKSDTRLRQSVYQGGSARQPTFYEGSQALTDISWVIPFSILTSPYPGFLFALSLSAGARDAYEREKASVLTLRGIVVTMLHAT
jgi:hypothetical protein